MRRFNKLLAGASWMGEYGDPDKPEEWAFIRSFSPYHTIAKDSAHPPILITTSTRDDRVHPGHARKMTALLESLGKQVLSYENIEGGHGGAADNKQRAFMDALAWTFLDRELDRPAR
jgi:prolyl oligopeptidase